MTQMHTRRNFLRAASATAAAVGLPLSDGSLVATAEAQVFSHEPSQLLTADRMANALMALAAKPGDKSDDAIFGKNILPFTIALTVEKNTIDTQFEYHEDRDHLFQILDGETTLEVDGTPQGGHSEQPGQWHSPTSQGTSVHTLRKGDMLLIPRGAPHKRSTRNSVTFMLISVTSPLKR
jgi:mannose-6-phosphate isomerase-like protein (cupin superfamily)